MSSQLSDFRSLADGDHLTALVPVWDAGEETSVLSDTGLFLLGSSRQCDIRVAVPGVAAEHCQIECSNGDTWITALHEQAVSVNDAAVNQPLKAKAGDMLAIGSATFRIEARKASRVRRPVVPKRLPGEPEPVRNPEKQIQRIETQIAGALAEHSAAQQVAVPVSASSTREAQLMNLQVRLEQRSMELDARSEQLTLQQTQLLTRQTELQQRRTEIEQRHRQEFAQISEERNSLLGGSSNELEDQAAALSKLSSELDARQRILRDKESKLQEASERLASRDFELEQVRDELNAARERQATEREAFEVQLRELKDRTADVTAKAADLQAAQQQMDQLRQEHRSEQESLVSQLRDLEARHAEERAEWLQQTETLKASAQQFAAQETELETARSQFEEAKREHLSRIADARSDLERREAELSWQQESIEVQRQTAKQAVDQAKAQKLEVQAARERLQQEQGTQSEELKVALGEIETLRSEARQREAAAVEHSAKEQQRITELEVRTAEAENEQRDLAEQNELIKEQAQQLAEDISALERAREDHQVTVSEWDRKHSQTEDDLHESLTSMKAMEQRLQQESHTITQRYAELQTQAESQDAQFASQRESVQERRDELEERASELTAWQAELQQRHDETASRIQQFKQVTAKEKSLLTAAPSVAEREQFAKELETERSQRESLTAERDNLLTALNELRLAFEGAKAELIQHDADAAQAANEPPAFDPAELEQAREETRQLQQQLNESTQQFETERQQLAEQLEVAQQLQATAEASDNSEQLTQEVDQLKSELAAAKKDDEDRNSLAQKVLDYEAQVRTLTAQVTEAQTAATVEAPAGDLDAQPCLDIIAELKQQLEAQQQEGTAAPAVDGEHGSSEEIVHLHRELDDRTVVLDKREEEIRERQRMVENSENEIEDQRRALLESRQQLELARAEIQVAMSGAEDTPQPTDPPTQSSLPEPEEPATAQASDEQNQEDSSPHVRSEIAELFGLAEPKPSLPDTTSSESDLPAVDDYSQETSAAVSLSFNQSESVLLSAPESPDVPTADEADEQQDEGEDLVASYMEQLLARSRTHAGESLPEELQKTAPAAAAPEEKKKPPGQASFIEAYMAGEYGDAGDQTAETPEASVSSATASASQEPAVPRPKIDLKALRSDMDSFRQLSTKSVENALATHAKRQKQGGMAARTTICLVLSLLSVFCVAAALMNVMPFGIIVYTLVLAAVISGAELGYQKMALNKRVDAAAKSVTSNPRHDAPTTEEPVASPLDEAAPQTAPVASDDAVDTVVPPLAPEPKINDDHVAELTAEDIQPEVADDDASPAPVAEEARLPDSADTPPLMPPPVPQATQTGPTESLGRSQIEDLLAEITGGTSGSDDK